MKRKKNWKRTAAGLSVWVIGVSAIISPAAVSAAALGEIDVNPQIHYQTLKGWGTSLCWWGNIIGSWGDQDFNGNGRADREEIAELAFSPEYLNLNIVRYNVGGGDKEDTSIKRSEGIVPGWTVDMTGTKDGTGEFVAEAFYGKSTEEMADAGQLWMLEQANAYRQAENDIINEVFSNSPPYYMTKSGSSTGGYSWDLNNLKEDQYDEFAIYMARAAKWIDQDLESKYGTGVSYIEPLNEPDTNYWQNGSTKQEGCIFNTGELQSKAYREMAAALDSEGIGDIQITGTDETALYNAINSFRRLDDDVKERMTTIGAHTYSGNDSERRELKNLAAQYDKDLWMSEVTRGGGSHYDGCHESMDAGNTRSQSEGIMADLKYMQPTAWIAWLVADSEYECLQTDSNWGLLHAVFEDDGPVPDYHWNLVNDDGSKKHWVPEAGYWAVTKQFYTMMQYSKFLKAGYTMIDISDSNMCAALSPEGDELVIVAQNFDNARKTSVSLGRFKGTAEAQIYRTSDTESCELVETQDVTDGVLNINLPYNSVTTYVIHSVNGSALCSMGDYARIVEADVAAVDSSWVSDIDKFSYTGSWGESGDEFGGGKYSTEEGASAAFIFEGDRAVIYGTKASDGAVVNISVDGHDMGQVDLAADTKDGNALLYDTGKLESGIHTVTMTKAEEEGNRLIELNYAKVIHGEIQEEGENEEANILYFVDCNSLDSPVYKEISQRSQLLNDKADQAYVEGSWGYRDAYGEYNGEISDKYDTGWYAYSGQNIAYTFPLEAGRYYITFGFKEWWKDSNPSRPMKISVTKDGEMQELGISDTWDGGNYWNRDMYTIDCAAAGDVTFTLEKAANSDPVLSFIQIQGRAPEIQEETADMSSLKLAIGMVEKMAEEQEASQCYTAESWAAVERVLVQAKALAENSEVSQEEVDQAFLDLIIACNIVENVPQRVGLKAAIDGAEAVLSDAAELAQYTEDSVAAVSEALDAAKMVYVSQATDQGTINSATTNLLTAVTSLLTKEKDTRLDVLIQTAEELLKNEDSYTPSTVKNLKQALEKARETVADSQVTDEKIDEAYKILAQAMTSLTRKANKDELGNALDKAREILGEQERYLDTTIQGLEEAVTSAQQVYDDQEADDDTVGETLKHLIQELLKARLLGDVDLNGEVNTADAAELLQYHAELKTLTEEQIQIGDVNQSGNTDLNDTVSILRYASEKTDIF